MRSDRPAAGRICVLALCSTYTRWGGLTHGVHGDGPVGRPSTFGTGGPERVGRFLHSVTDTGDLEQAVTRGREAWMYIDLFRVADTLAYNSGCVFVNDT